MTTHGCRSSFRDWAGDETRFERDIAMIGGRASSAPGQSRPPLITPLSITVLAGGWRIEPFRIVDAHQPCAPTLCCLPASSTTFPRLTKYGVGASMLDDVDNEKPCRLLSFTGTSMPAPHRLHHEVSRPIRLAMTGFCVGHA